MSTATHSRFDATLVAASAAAFVSLVVVGSPLLGLLLAGALLAVGLAWNAPTTNPLLVTLGSAAAVLLAGVAVPTVVFDLPSVGVHFDQTTLLVTAATGSLLAMTGALVALRRLRTI